MFPPTTPQTERELWRLELARIEREAAYWANAEPQPRNYRRVLSRLLHLAVFFRI
jgi:hypothetical protein